MSGMPNWNSLAELFGEKKKCEVSTFSVRQFILLFQEDILNTYPYHKRNYLSHNDKDIMTHETYKKKEKKISIYNYRYHFDSLRRPRSNTKCEQ